MVTIDRGRSGAARRMEDAVHGLATPAYGRIVNALLQGDPMPADGTARAILPPKDASAPGTGWRHAFAYWRGTVGNLIRPHHLDAQARPERRAPVSISAAQRAEWQQVFHVDPRVQAPLLYNQRVGTLLYTQLFGEMRINFRHLLHLRHRVEHRAGAAACANADDHQLICRVTDVRRVFAQRAVITVRSDIRRSPERGGALLSVVYDDFVVRALPLADLAGMDGDPALERVVQGLRRRRPELCATSAQVWCESMPLPADLGRRYGRISGDCNPVHTTAWAARLFGVKRPFAQGLALRNAVVARLAALGMDLGRFEMTFASPACLGQSLELRVANGRFELLGSQGELVAFGESGEI